ncbi:MAG: ribulose-phosphate 3-epimerase [Rickettsiales endosymbiont of Dermacentor nuttalli]
MITDLKIAPSILSADFSKLGEEVKSITEAGASYLHIDVMDGHFVQNITIGPVVVRSIRPFSNLTFDVHLMISEADKYIKAFADAGADIITIHAEACIHLERSVQLIKSLGKKAGISLIPTTHPSILDYILPELDLVMVMTVNPGFAGQTFIPSQLDKIKIIRQKIDRLDKKIDLEVDGSINLTTVKNVVEAGANVLVAGEYIFKDGDYKNKINSLIKAAY